MIDSVKNIKNNGLYETKADVFILFFVFLVPLHPIQFKNYFVYGKNHIPRWLCSLV